MRSVFLTMSAFVLLTPLSVADAQEWSGGAMDPVAVSNPMAVQAASEAQARRLRGRQSRASRATRTAQTCGNVPRARERLGADNPRVQRLAQLCRQAGY